MTTPATKTDLHEFGEEFKRFLHGAMVRLVVSVAGIYILSMAAATVVGHYWK